MRLPNRLGAGLLVCCIVLLIHTSGIPAEYAIRDIGTLGGTKSCAYAVNNLGQVVGSAGTQDTDGQMRAFLYDTVGGIRKLDPNFNTTYSIALDINDAGQATGYFGASNPHAFLYKPGLARGRPVQRLPNRPVFRRKVHLKLRMTSLYHTSDTPKTFVDLFSASATGKTFHYITVSKVNNGQVLSLH